MGCDIHISAEIRKDNQSTWEQVIEPVFKSYYYRANDPIDDWNKPFTSDPFGGRDYDLFAILADVRNGRGFAGIKTGEGFNVIAQPKGIPIDVSPGVMKEYTLEVGEEYSLGQLQSWVDRGISEWVKYSESVSGPDWHSASWLTLAEILAFDWGQITMKRGVVTFEEYKKYKETNEINSYSGAVFGGGIVTIDEHDADKIINGGEAPTSLDKLYVNCNWPVLYSDTCKWFLSNTVETLKTLGDPENVRLVFWFDN